jgi:hypothetical protein
MPHSSTSLVALSGEISVEVLESSLILSSFMRVGEMVSSIVSVTQIGVHLQE